MVNWKSPEEAEAWWERLIKLEARCDAFDRDFINISKAAAMNAISILISNEKHDYMKRRQLYYVDKINNSINIDEIGKELKMFIQEYKQYKGVDLGPIY